MKNKEILSALGLSISLTVTACGAPAQQPEQIKEPVAVTTEQPTEQPVEETEPEEEKEESQEPVAEEPVEKEVSADIVEEVPEYEIEPMDDTTMWAKQQSNIRNKPHVDDSEIIGGLKAGQQVTVNGKVVYKEKTWYVLKPTEDSEDKETEFVSGSLLSASKPSSGNSGNSGSTKPSTGTTNPAPAPSDCAVADCGNYCNEYGDCDISGIPDLGVGSDCDANSWCPAAE